jgi:hypothetical protein
VKYCFILALLLFAGNANAQAFSQPQFLSSTPFELKSALLIDLEGDGDLDALSGGTGFNADGIETWVNNNGQFILVTGNIPFSQFGAGVFAAADIDMDGDMDFATVIEGNLVVYSNDGNGQFANPTILDSEAADVRSIAFGQLDATAGSEIVVTRIDNEDVLLYANDGAGNYGAAITVTTASVDPIDARIGDLNGDGLNDIAVACLNGCDVTWHENLGSLNFSTQLTAGLGQTGTYELALADFDNNGSLDIASVGFGSDDLSVFLNDGGGLFGAQTIISINVDGATNLASGDFNGDGHADLCVGAENIDYPTLFLGNGSGAFTELYLDKTGSVSNPEEYLAGDIDGDGKTDLLTASQDDNKLSWFRQKPGTILPNANPFQRQRIINKPASQVNDLATADIDGDGAADLISTERASGRVVLYRNEAAGSLGEHEVLLQLNEGLAGLDVGDVNGDGAIDLVVSNNPDSAVVLYLNQGDGSVFTEVIIDQGLDGPYSPVLADLDDDGDLDILQASGWDQAVYIYPNTGAGDFGTRLTLCNDCLFSTALAAKDLNGDNLPEILVYVAQNQWVELYENLGDLTFGIPEVIINNINGCRDIKFSDFDDDGDTDVFSCGIFVNRIKYAENTGDLNFLPEADIPFGVNSAYAIEFLDVDLDGEEDLAYADFFSNQIRYIRIESGDFVERRSVDNSAYQNPTSLLAADFDGDGAEDLVGGYWNYLALYENLAGTCSALSPENLNVEIENNTANFSWDPVPNTAGCRISLQNQQGQLIQQNIFGTEVSEFSAPVSALPGGPSFTWRVQCACSISPLELTANSPVDFFSVPQGLKVYPNPVQENLSVIFESGFTPSGKSYRITDLQGRIVKEGIYTPQLNLINLESGFYLIEMDGRVSRFFKK